MAQIVENSLEKLNLALLAFVLLVLKATWKICKFQRNQKMPVKLQRKHHHELIFSEYFTERLGEAESELKIDV